MHAVITAEQVVADRNDVMQEAGSQEEEDHRPENPGNEPGVCVDRSGDSRCKRRHRHTSWCSPVLVRWHRCDLVRIASARTNSVHRSPNRAALSAVVHAFLQHDGDGVLD